MIASDSHDEDFMRRALALARQAWGRTHPNPMVGAVIVEAGEIVAEGWHHAAGQDHAEVSALKALGRKPAADATLYVTLEPCSTCGRTGACTNAILEAGIARVVVGAEDPNPAHAGAGLDVLRAAGVEVISGVLAEECADLNLIFNHWITEGTPLIAMKMALTLDGKFAASSGQSQWVTSETARADVMLWRRYFPAIAVAANTVIADNPSLTSRTGDTVWCPQRFVFDRSLRTLELEALAKVYSDDFKEKTTVVCLESADDSLKEKAASLGLTVWALPECEGHIDWSTFRARCAEAGICGVYVETGPGLATSIMERRLADYAFVYQAPKFMADAASAGLGSTRSTESMSEAIALSDVRHAILGDDHLVRGFLKR